MNSKLLSKRVSSRPHFVNLFTMTQADSIRNSIIDKLLTISNKEQLSALYLLVEKSAPNNDVIQLSPEQSLLLQLSDKDIQEGKTIDQDRLDKDDLLWLKGK